MLLLLLIGAGVSTPIPPVDTSPYVGDTTVYDLAGATGSASGAMIQSSEATYDSAGATGPISGATILPPETTL